MKYQITLEDLTQDELKQLNPILNEMFEFRANVCADSEQSHEFYKKRVDALEKIITGPHQQ